MHRPDPAPHRECATHQPCETGTPSICGHASCEVQCCIGCQNGNYYRERDQSIVIVCRDRGKSIHLLTLRKRERVCLLGIIGRKRVFSSASQKSTLTNSTQKYRK